MIVRSLEPGDVGALGELVDADRLPGQPACTPDRAAAVLAGRSRSAGWWWDQLVSLRTVALTSESGELLGAGAVGRGPEGDPHLLWLHAREDRSVLDRLLFNLLRGVRRSTPAYAFRFGTDLAPAVEGLPHHRRPATHAALAAKGFTGSDRWLYLQATGTGPTQQAPVRTRGHGGEQRIEVTDERGTVMGEAEVSMAGEGTGVVWWLEVDPDHRRSGWGRQALRAARHVLAGLGATHTVLVVDHDAPDERDRRPALALYESEGFEVVDHLWEYRRP